MNNDRFKFLVWDKAEKYYGGFPFHLSQFGELEMVSVDGTLLDTDSNRYVVEQCTGLKDKNGKLIFEGDIVLIDKGDDCFEEREVSWYDFQSCLCFKMEIGKMTSYQRLGSVSSKNVEIIGNIHEIEVEK